MEASGPYATELQTLLHTLQHLPASIPEDTGYYNFDQCHGTDPGWADWRERTGSNQGALNHKLEIAFSTCENGPVKFEERGRGLEAVVEVLRNWLTGTDGQNLILKKWVDDLTEAGRGACNGVGVNNKLTLKGTGQDEERVTKARAKEAREAAKQARQTALDITSQDVNEDIDTYVDIIECEAETGRPGDNTLRRLSQKCKSSVTGKIRFRCKIEGCRESWAGRQSSRILNHVANRCALAPEHLRSLAVASLSSTSLVDELNHSEGKEEAPVRATGSKKTPVLSAAAKQEGRLQKNIRFNHRVLRLLCAGNLPPSVVDLDEWAELVTEANTAIHTACSTTFSDIYIPQEAARVLQLSIKNLKKHSNLTLSFDGGTTRRPQSVYTVHVTAPVSRKAYLMAGDEASGKSHTADHVRGVLMKVRR
ncbi:hypothetical protein FRB94_004931 [Tulasnella sp. JGI-2019a]|nr:hypothetical protein FRB93_001551 [Tulasnella sp. JGI-2019a]KAG8984262.1 hypothetical protein FRB94_004931 [Tulasnella sp. JGI-2019a]